MSEFLLSESPAHEMAGEAAPVAPAEQQACQECIGSGGWYRYEPALDPAPGLLYLSCVQCRGSGRTAHGRA